MWKSRVADAPGVRSVMETCEEAKQKKLAIVSGLCWRYDLAKRETNQRVFDGAIGDIVAMQENYLTGTLLPRRKPEWSEMEYQMRNWQYFTWLSGDHNVEQHIHSLDKAAWAMHDVPPVKCLAWAVGKCATQGAATVRSFRRGLRIRHGPKIVCPLPANGRLRNRSERLFDRHERHGLAHAAHINGEKKWHDATQAGRYVSAGAR